MPSLSTSLRSLCKPPSLESGPTVAFEEPWAARRSKTSTIGIHLSETKHRRTFGLKKNGTFLIRKALKIGLLARVSARVSACFLDFFRPIFEGRTFSAAAPDRTFGPFTAEFCRFEALPTLFKPSGLIEADRTFSAPFRGLFRSDFLKFRGPRCPIGLCRPVSWTFLAPLCQHRSCWMEGVWVG